MHFIRLLNTILDLVKYWYFGWTLRQSSNNSINEIKGSQKIKIKAKRTSWNQNMKDNSWQDIAKTFLERVSFEQHEELKITLSLCVEFSESVAKIYFLSNLLSWNTLNYLT